MTNCSKNTDTNEWVRWIENGIAEDYIKYHNYDEFQNIKYINGRGFSKVYRATWKSSNIVALKYLENNDLIMKEIVNEIKLLHKINIHPNIIRFFGITGITKRDNLNYSLVFEYADSGTLRNYLENNFKKLDWKIKLQFSIQIADAVLSLHQKDIIHQDLLHSNSILVHQNMIKLDLSPIEQQFFRMVPYSDQQHFKGNYKANKEFDIYCVGVLLWEISSGFVSYNNTISEFLYEASIFDDHDNYYIDNYTTTFTTYKDGKRETPIFDGVPIDYINVYTKCWQDNPSDRSDMQKVYSDLKLINLDMDEMDIDNDEWFINKHQKNDDNDDNDQLASRSVMPGIISNDGILALALYKEVVEEGHVISINDPGNCSRNGTGTKKNEIEAFFLYREAAEKGVIDSIYNLGNCYLYGIGTKKNEILAFELYKKAAEKGHIVSIHNLGCCYKNGIGTKKNEIKAFELYKVAAEKGVIDSIHNLGYCYQIGIGTKKNEIKAFKLCKEAAEKGYVSSVHNLGNCYWNGIGTKKNKIKALELYKVAAKKGYVSSVHNLGNCYWNGVETEKNEILAFELYKEAAEKGHVGSIHNLGYCYRNGIGTKKNEILAFELYKKAAENYKNGIGTEKDKFELYKEAAEKGYIISINNLGCCYQNGVGTKKNEILAFELYKVAAEKGVIDSIHNLGYCYQNAIGTEKNEILAFELYKKADEKGIIDSMHNLGYCYQNGIGTGKNEILAFELYKKAAEKGHIFAQSDLGLLYENGGGTEKDLEKAIYWYNKAANNGDKVAQYCSDILSFIVETDKLSYYYSIEWIPHSQITNFEEIAEGGFGIIYKALYNNNTVAIKKLLHSQNPSKYFLNELKSLYQCYDDKFECISKCYGITKDPKTKEFMFIMKYANGGNLHNYLQDNFNNITWKRKLYILWRISDGLQAIHEKNFIHRDFHSGNILVETIENIDQYFIGDLGLSQPANISDNKICYGIIPYIAPEIFKGAAFSKTSDIYSMGMIIWELTTGCKPFANIEHNVNLIYEIIDGKRPKITNDTPEDFANLMKKCWNPDPEKRPLAKKLCKAFNVWLYTEDDIKQFNQAEEIRLELIKSEMLGPKFSEKSHSKAIYTSKPLDSLISKLSINSSLITSTNMKVMKQEYISRKSHELNINDTQSEYELDIDTQREYELDINDI